MEEKRTSVSSIVISVVFLSWFALSTRGMVMAGKAEQPGWVAILLGQYFLVFGLIWLYKEVKAGGIRQPIFFLFPIVGFLTVSAGLLWQFGDDVMKEMVVTSIPNILAGLFLGIGIYLLITGALLWLKTEADAALVGVFFFMGAIFVFVSTISICAYNFM